jgi:hypothetical protein
MPDTIQTFAEATTVKHRARALLRDIEALLADKGLGEDVTAPLASLRDKLKAKWSDLTADEPTAESLTVEAAAVLAQDDSYDGRRCAVQAALWQSVAASGGMMGEGPYPWIRDLYDDVVVFQLGDGLFRADYTIDADDIVTLGEPAPVELSYTPVAAGMEEAVTKTDAGVAGFTARDYAYTPDKSKPSTWKLRLTTKPGADPDAGMVGAAAAALGPGYRGQKVDIPDADRSAVKARVRAAWKKANPDKLADDMPSGIKEAKEVAAESAGLHDVVLEGEIIPLIEKAVKKDGTLQLKVIEPGWGSSGYYPASVLKRDGPRVFTKGLHQFWNHQTAQEAAARPEGDLRDLAAVLLSDAEWRDQGLAGPGLYATAKALNGYAPSIEELAPHIGVSIRAFGKAEAGEAEGRKGPIIQELTSGQSVDFVTQAGAGGEILSLFEAARSRPTTPTDAPNPGERSFTVDEEQARALREANAANEAQIAELRETVQRQQEAILLRDARELLMTTLRTLDMPDITRQRLSESLLPKAPFKDGQLDRPGYETLIKETWKGELAYLSQASGVGDGRIRGMGASHTESDATSAKQCLAEALGTLGGLTPELAQVAANGRTR